MSENGAFIPGSIIFVWRVICRKCHISASTADMNQTEFLILLDRLGWERVCGQWICPDHKDEIRENGIWDEDTTTCLHVREQFADDPMDGKQENA